MKHPRTPHLPGSKSTSDDLLLSSNARNGGTGDYAYSGDIVITEKMDGSNIMVNRSKFITRSGKLSSADWTFPARRTHQQVAHLLPKKTWLTGELVFWRKSIAYDSLPGEYLVFGAVDENGDEPTALSYDETTALTESVGLPNVPLLARGHSDDLDAMISDAKKRVDMSNGNMEGFVVRPAASFPFNEYESHVAKWVRGGYQPTAGNNGVNGIIGTR